MPRKTEIPSVRKTNRRNKPKSDPISSLDIIYGGSVLVYFAGSTIFYSMGMIIASFAQLVNLLDIHLTAFGVQVLPIMSQEKLIYLMFSSSMAVPWGLATLGVLFGSKLLLIPIQICKISSTCLAVSAALAQRGEDNFRECLLVTVAEVMPLAVIYLVAIIMACNLHRPLIYMIVNIGRQEVSKREVRINIVRSAEEGAVVGDDKKKDEGTVSELEKVTAEDIIVALPSKEEELRIKMAAESNGINPELQPSDSLV